MGNEQSQFSGIEIEEKSIEVSDYWSLHLATLNGSENTTNLSVFIEEKFVRNQFWISQSPLQKNVKNLMVYRHPCILKYVSSWQKNLKSYLAVEEVTPLAQVLTKLNGLQISVGLYSILKALCFLHEKASVSHNNVCISSVYVTQDGNWRLGGMEFLCKYEDLTPDCLIKNRGHRYSKAVDSNEDRLLKDGRKDIVDIYGLSVFITEVLKTKNDDEIPGMIPFLKYCQNEMQNVDVTQRPNFRIIMEHEFFNQDFIKIHSFLIELPLKMDTEKTEFFKTLGDKLRLFDEELVASQLSGLLLSRMVLLNNSAQNMLLPILLSVRSGLQAEEKSLFSIEVFKKYLCPKLIEIFQVRDVQIRLLLLDHFHNFMHIFSQDELQLYILPELLVGIKDTNDQLVSATLKTLADLVPILGAATVIGGRRAKLFNDGRPTHSVRRRKSRDPFVSSHVNNELNPDVIQNDLRSLSGTETGELPERPRPDGEEETSTEEMEQSADDDLENWDDWDVNENNPNINIQSVSFNNSSLVVDDTIKTNESEQDFLNRIEVSKLKTDSTMPKKSLPSIQELDIKNQLNSNNSEEIDFFEGMEPAINTSKKFFIDAEVARSNEGISRKLAITTDQTIEDGWENNEWE